MKPINRSQKLSGVCYDIRGPVLEEARRLEEEGHKILKLNIGNPAPFGFEAPDDILKDVIHNLPTAQGYGPSNGLYSAKVAIHQYYQTFGLLDTSVDDIYVGNGVSELIVMAMQALLNDGDEILVPSPDYPLWTAAIKLSGGTPVHYVCDEASDWYPDLDDIKSKITAKTRAIIIINPNNPTGAVYPKEILQGITQLARENNLIIYSDEIYDKILYNGAKHIPIATLSDDVFCITFGGLSKNYRVAGFRVGWMILTGPKRLAQNYIGGLDILSSMRLCANIPMQHAIQTALGGYQSIYDLTADDGRLYQQMELSYQLVNAIPGVSCTRPKGAMYLFPKIDIERFNIKDDEQFVLDFLREKQVLLVHGRAFNWRKPDHFRIVFLPHHEELEQAIMALGEFLDGYQQV
ncbi:pyridoxal phosphate-dependent aminotransferase [Aliikangiella coralliicola]|uniref:Glutamate-pyruvate aminotransferase AlaA n=1 Tax=Aliikangiella coralliicola TaxID=2592383 RepID=A0A545UFX2_9GAMM|nr:pyridoxal phosphate-dependent aminotransferase [Aliikangiella coralliicola]TQV88374.1 pyridoxal phosphate-dependent aminotransferase [Aliikangiella coralliicola]